MFDSISNIFSLPKTTKNRYKVQPSFQQFLKQNKNKSKHNFPLEEDPLFDSLKQNLKNPVEEWILHQESHLHSLKVNKLIFGLIARYSSQRNQKIINEQQPLISVHNFFVLVVQYEVMSEFIKNIQIQQLQLLIDGACGILIKNPNDSMEELTCIIHHIITKSHLYHSDKQSTTILTRPLEIDHIPNFVKIYSDLPKQLGNSFFDSVVRIIPMFAELFKLIARTNPHQHKSIILGHIPWIQQIDAQLLELICKNIEEVLKIELSNQPLEIVISEKEQNPELKKKMIEQAIKIFNLAGFISAKELFIHACRQLYYFQHVFRLDKFISELVQGNQELQSLYQSRTIIFIKKYIKMCLKFDVNIPNTHFICIGNILRRMQFETNQQIRQILPDIKGQYILNSLNELKEYPLYQWQQRQKAGQLPEHPQFTIDKSQNCLLLYLVRLIFNLQVEYISVLNIVLTTMNKNYLPTAQLLLIKNNFLHFLIQEQITLQGQDKKTIKQFFLTISNIVKNNPLAYCILDQILQREKDKNKKCVFVDQIKKHFYESKDFLLLSLADTININSKQKNSKYFLPLPLSILFYPDSETKHDIWISYIHDVIVRQLNSQLQKLNIFHKADPSITKDKNEWITLAIMIQIQHVLQKRGDDLQLGQFTMNYLTNILNQAIKWKYQDETEVMKRILNNYEQWEIYYTDVILNTDNNDDVIEIQLGGAASFLSLRRWNKKICNSIHLFIESVLTTVVDPKAPLF